MKSNGSLERYTADIISNIVRTAGFKNYLELGVDTGFTISNVARIEDIQTTGVDLRGADILKYPQSQLTKFIFNTTTDSFFEQNTSTYDCIFIDADHSYAQSKKDFHNSYKVLENDGIIFLHDTYPPNVEMTQPGRCGDVYKLYIELKSQGYEIINLPIWNGLSILRKIESNLICTI